MMFAAPECQTYSLAAANRDIRQTVSLALRTIFMLKTIAFNKMSVPLRSAKLTVWQAQTGNFAKL
jgi:hypothetical protein